MTRKATHTGTCQVCGRRQMLPGGIVAKHGYVVKNYGFFNGICPGASYPALEEDRALADTVAADLRRQAFNDDALASKILAGHVFPKWAAAGFSCLDREGRWTDVEVRYADADEHHQRRAVELLLHETQQRAKQGKDIANAILARADRITGKQPLQPRAVEQRREIVAGMRVKLYGREITVLRIEERAARGIGPHINGRVMPHIVYERDGREFVYPVRLIKQSSIIA